MACNGRYGPGEARSLSKLPKLKGEREGPQDERLTDQVL
jgi:hypothetical protein